MIAKFREFSDVIRQWGYKHILFVIGTLLFCGFVNLTFGERGLYAIIGLVVLGLLVQMKDFWTKTLEIGSKSFKKVWVWFVAVTTFLLLSWAIGKIFGPSTASSAEGLVAITFLSIILALNYATTEKKVRYNTLAIFLCTTYLVGNLVWKDFVTKEFKDGIDNWRMSQQNKIAASAEKKATITNLQAKIPSDVVILDPGLEEDLRTNDDAFPVNQSHRLERGEIVTFYPEKSKVLNVSDDYLGEPYAWIRYKDEKEKKYHFSWLRFAVLNKSIEMREEKKEVKAGDKVVVAQPPTHASPILPRDLWVKLADAFTVSLLPRERASKEYNLAPNQETDWFFIPDGTYTLSSDPVEMEPEKWYYFERNGKKDKVVPGSLMVFPVITGSYKGRFIAGENGANIVVSIFRNS